MNVQKASNTVECVYPKRLSWIKKDREQSQLGFTRDCQRLRVCLIILLCIMCMLHFVIMRIFDTSSISRSH